MRHHGTNGKNDGNMEGIPVDLDNLDEGSVKDVGVSENSVPLNPMVFMIIIPIKWLFHWEYTLFSDKPMSAWAKVWFCRNCCGRSPVSSPGTMNAKMGVPST